MATNKIQYDLNQLDETSVTHERERGTGRLNCNSFQCPSYVLRRRYRYDGWCHGVISHNQRWRIHTVPGFPCQSYHDPSSLNTLNRTDVTCLGNWNFSVMILAHVTTIGHAAHCTHRRCNPSVFCSHNVSA